MALTPRLDLKQVQQLVMTPKLQQAIRLLQYSNIEIRDYVTEQVEKNPILELGDTTEGEAPPAIEAAQDEALMGLTATDVSINKTGEVVSDEASVASNHVANEHPTNSHGDLPPSMIGKPSGDLRGLDETLGVEVDLHAHLMRQMPLLMKTQQEEMIAAHLVDLVDEAGYIDQDDVIDLAGRVHLDVHIIEEIVIRLQSLEPTGVFARDLTECLALQLREKDHLDPAMVKMLDHLDLLAKRDFAGLIKICEVDQDDILDMIDELQTLNPKPGLTFQIDDTQAIIPDIFVHQNEKGIWVVELNSETLPKVLVNEEYVAELEATKTGTETKEFIATCMTNANWLVKALEQRATTILKCASEIVKKQQGFFEHGVMHLQPMTLANIAEAIDMHESSISRVTTAKYMATPRGLFELKYFFSSGVKSADGESMVSAESVKSRIKELIDDEEPHKILSDDKLVKLLKSDGIAVARRTVAKYREAMRIPSSVQRRREKKPLR